MNISNNKQTKAGRKLFAGRSQEEASYCSPLKTHKHFTSIEQYINHLAAIRKKKVPLIYRQELCPHSIDSIYTATLDFN